MHSLVIGGSGFIGSAVVKCLHTKGVKVTSMDSKPSSPFHLRCDVTDYESLLKKVWLIHRENKIDCIYNFSGVLGTSEADSNMAWAVQVNVVGAINVLRVCETLDIPRSFYPTKPHPWLNTYTATKCAGENFALMFGNRGKVKVCGLRYFNVYGPGQKIGPVRKMIPAFCVEALSGLPLTIFGGGEQLVDVIDVDDVARLSVWMAENGPGNHFVDCGSGAGIEVRTVARYINEISGNKAGIVYKPMRSGEEPHSRIVADTTRLWNIIGGRPNLKDPFRCIGDAFEHYKATTTQEERTEAICSWFSR